MKISYIKYFFVAAVNLRIKSAEMKTGELSALNMWLSLTKPHFFFLDSQVVEDIITNRSTSGYNRKWMGMLRGLMFCCVHAGKNDLALKIQLVSPLELFSNFC